MLNKSDIIESVFLGWDNVTEFVNNTQDEENHYHFKPEYLVTVKIAESILKYFQLNGLLDQYSILLEENTYKAMTRRENEVLEYYKSGSPKLFRSKKESYRKGRFDIVIYHKNYFYSLDSYRTICVIEIKNYSGNFNQIKKDIVRINDFIDFSIISNSFEFGLMTFIIRPEKKHWKNLFNNESVILDKYLKKINQKLSIKEEWKVNTKIISKRYHDPGFPVLQYLYIILVITIS